MLFLETLQIAQVECWISISSLKTLCLMLKSKAKRTPDLPGFEACANVNGSLTDVFECRIGVRQGVNLSFLLVIVFLKDFQAFVSSKFTGLQPDVLVQNVQCLMKVSVLLYADDTLLLTETESDMQKAVEATLQYCKQN